MTTTMILAGILAPALFWMGYFYYKDRKQPEPVAAIGVAYLLGFVAAFLCIKLYGMLPSIGIPEDASILMDHHRWHFLAYCLGVVGLLEEVVKFLPFVVVILRFKAFDEKIDGMIYASMIALGFASFENFYYLNVLEGFHLVGRAIASPLTHTIFSSIWGYTVGVAFMEGRSLIKASLKGLFWASLVHGIFDFLTISPALRLTSAVIILVIWVWRIRKMEKLADEHIPAPVTTEVGVDKQI